MAVRPSLQGKITFGYFAVGTLIVGLSVLAFMELRLIERRILAGAQVSEFFDATLELRRFEKNYFLYHQAADYEENLNYAAHTWELLKDNAQAFSTLVPATKLTALNESLAVYPQIMAEYAMARPRSGEATRLERKIRGLGKAIVTLGEVLSRAERKTLQASLDRHRSNLILSIIGLMVLVLLIGQVLSRRVVRPLKEMEARMEAVANGKLSKLAMTASDREIVSLTQAFNHVLEELDVRQRHLIRSEKLASLGTLLSGVAHELNNPLSNISSSCQILQEEIEEADLEYQKELLNQIDEQCLRARNIVRSLLDFARDRAFKREALPLAVLVQETLRFVKGQVRTNVAITCEIADDLLVYGDKQRLQQALLNLFKNALEAMEGQGTLCVSGQLHIRAARRAAAEKSRPEPAEHYLALGECKGESDVVEIEVRDTGHGIPPEVLPRIFDPFFTTKAVGKGSGLGLFIVFEIIEEHDGCMAVESQPGAGTAFFIRLPQGITHD